MIVLYPSFSLVYCQGTRPEIPEAVSTLYPVGGYYADILLPVRVRVGPNTRRVFKPGYPGTWLPDIKGCTGARLPTCVAGSASLTILHHLQNHKNHKNHKNKTARVPNKYTHGLPAYLRILYPTNLGILAAWVCCLGTRVPALPGLRAREMSIDINRYSSMFDNIVLVVSLILLLIQQ